MRKNESYHKQRLFCNSCQLVTVTDHGCSLFLSIATSCHCSAHKPEYTNGVERSNVKLVLTMANSHVSCYFNHPNFAMSLSFAEFWSSTVAVPSSCLIYPKQPSDTQTQITKSYR